MAEISGNYNRNILVMLLAALVLALMVVNSQCRHITRNEIKEEDEGDENMEMKWVLEMSSRDEMVQMAGYGEEKLSTVLITGSVVCNKACLAAKHGNHHQLQLRPQPISGALVGAECHANNKKVKSPSWAKAIADEYGEFMIELPSHLHGIPNLDKKCSVKILELPMDSPCQLSTIKNKEIKLASVGNGIRTYTAGRVELLHTMPKNSEACMKGQKGEQEMSW